MFDVDLRNYEMFTYCTCIFVDFSIVVPRLKLTREKMINLRPPETSSFTDIDDVICKYSINYIVLI